MTPSNSPPGHSRRWWEWAVLAAAGLGCLIPFAGKDLSIDDPLFVWAAQHIRQHPLDFFGFQVHWYISWQSMAEVTQNPPGACYYLALAGALFGWGEVGLHLAMILPALGVLWGTHRLADRLGVRPLPAALLTLASPAFLLCSSTLMCDTLMLCLWMWAVILWDQGLRDRTSAQLYCAGFLVGLAALTKYFGAALMPLLVAYGLAVNARSWRRWLAPVGLALTMILAYELLTKNLYGHGHISGAMEYAKAFRHLESSGHMAFRLCSGLAFVGGCVGMTALAIPVLLSWRLRGTLLAATAGVLAFALLLPTVTDTKLAIIADSPFALGIGRLSHDWSAFVQFAIWVTAGLAVLLLAAADLAERRDAPAWLLFLWIVGTYLFAAYFNWALNGRSIVPLVPAVAILFVRRLGPRGADRAREPAWFWPAVLLPSLVLALLVTWADARFAKASRVAADQLSAEFGDGEHRLWYTGHWGFQYYMKEHGAQPWDFDRPEGKPGDPIVIPKNNAEYPVKLPRNIRDLTVRDVSACPWLSTLHKSVGAGFYSDYWGPLPFAFGQVPPERFEVKELIPIGDAPTLEQGKGRR